MKWVLLVIGAIIAISLYLIVYNEGKRHLAEMQTKSKILSEWVGCIVLTLTLLACYMVLFLLCVEFSAWPFISLAQAMALLGIWWLSAFVANKVVGNENELFDKKTGWYNWCNLIALIGMIIAGIFVFVLFDDKDIATFIQLMSMALSIFIGAYISSDLMFQHASWKNFKSDLKKSFPVPTKKSKMIGEFIIAITLIIVVLYHKGIPLDFLVYGFAGGSIGFCLVLGFIPKKDKGEGAVKKN